MPEVDAANIAHVKMRVLEPSITLQQTSNGSDVLEFVMINLQTLDSAPGWMRA
jgi:hypothetical protein